MGATIIVGDASFKPNAFESLAVAYLGKPMHFLASLFWAFLGKIALLLIRRTKAKPALKQNAEVGHSPRQPVVRLRNLPQSKEYFVNRRGNPIHFRSYLPESADVIKALVLFSHGYGAHCNSPRKHQMGLAMPKYGLCMYQIDLEGHGYSGGERAYIEDYNHWVDDYRQLLELVAGDGTDAAPHFLAASAAQRKRLREVPIFIAGESLGGALSILLGLSLQESNHPLLPRFKGEVLLAPAIQGNPPPPALVSALRHLVVPLIPRWQVPSCLESVNRPEMCVLEADERRHANHDVLGYPGGLGWGGNMRFRTGLNLIDLTAEVSRRLEHVKFPFLIMHDPGDCIVRYDSSRELKYRASTPRGSPRGRELQPMEGWLHCLLTNCPEIAIQHLQDWVLYQTNLYYGGSSSGSTSTSTSTSTRQQGVKTCVETSLRGCVTKRGGVTRKSVAVEPAAEIDAGDGAATSNDTSTSGGSSCSGCRSPGADDGVAFPVADLHAAAAALLRGDSGVVDKLGCEYDDSSSLPPVRFSASPGVLDGYGQSLLPVADEAAHNTTKATLPPIAAAHRESSGSDTQLDMCPQTAAAAAVAAAATVASAAVTGDKCDTSTEPPIDLPSTKLQASPLPLLAAELVKLEAAHEGGGVVTQSSGVAAAGVGVVQVGAGVGVTREEMDAGPEASLSGDLNIDSPSRVAGILLS